MYKEKISRSGTIKIAPYKWMITIAIFFLVLYPFSVSLSNYIYRSTILKYLTLLFVAFAFFWQWLTKEYSEKRGLRLNKTEVFIFLIGVYITINNYDIRNGSYYYILTFWIFWIISVTGKFMDNWQETLFRMVEVFTMFYAIITIVCFLSSGFYFRFIIPLFDSVSQKQLTIAYNHGYMAGLTDHYSTNGMYLSIGVGIVGSKLLNDFKSFKNILCAFIMLGALLLTGKRGPLLFSVMAMVIVYYFYKEDRPKGRLFKIFGLMLLGIGAALIVSIWVPQILNVVNRFFSESDSGDVTAGRGPLYALAFALFKQKPLTGHGWGSYPSFYYESLGRYMTVYKYRHAHNIYLQLLCETGIIGFGLYIAFFVYNLVLTLDTFKTYRKDKSWLPYSADYILPFCLFVQIFFIMYGMTGNPLYDVAVLFPYYFSIMYVNYYRRKCLKINATRSLMRILYQKGAVTN